MEPQKESWQERFDSAKGNWEVYGAMGIGINYSKLKRYFADEIMLAKIATQKEFAENMKKIMKDWHGNGLSMIEDYEKIYGYKI